MMSQNIRRLVGGGLAAALLVARPAALLVQPGGLGPRLVRIEPFGEGGARGGVRVATIVVEQLIGGAEAAPGSGDAFVIPTTLAPVTLRARGSAVDRQAGTAS